MESHWTSTETAHLRLGKVTRMSFVAILLPFCALTQVVTNQEAPYISISGRLVDKLANPIESGAVFLSLARSPIIAAGCRLDRNGTFKFPPLPPGPYALHFDVPGFSPRVQTVTRNATDLGTIVLEVAPGESPTELLLHRSETLNTLHLAAITGFEGKHVSRPKRQDQINKLIAALHATPWLGAENICIPMC